MSKASSPRRSGLTPFYVILGVVALAGVGILLYQLYGDGGGEATTAPVAVTIDPTQLARTPGMSIGRADAPVVIYEFADFQCPACGDFARYVSPLIKERFVEPGTVRYVYYDFPLTQIHQHAFLAARAGRCANEQERFWEFHDWVYGRQSEWSFVDDAADLFVDYAGEAGLDQDAFETCLRSDRYAQEVTQSLRFGESLGVSGTPTIFVNGKRLPEPPSISELERIIQAETGGVPAAAAPATE